MFSLFKRPETELEQILKEWVAEMFRMAIISCHGVSKGDPEVPEDIKSLNPRESSRHRDQFVGYITANNTTYLYMAFDYCLVWAYVFQRFYYTEFKRAFTLKQWRNIYQRLVYLLRERFLKLKNLNREFDTDQLDVLLNSRYTTYANFQEVIPPENNWYNSIFGQFQRYLETDYQLDFNAATMGYARAYGAIRMIDIAKHLDRLKPVLPKAT